MIGYTMVGTTDLERALRFYDPLFEEMGLEQCWRDAQSVSWGDASNAHAPRFFAGYPFDGLTPSAGNGTMTALRVKDVATINRLHSIALRNGGQDEGEPGYRPHYGEGFYGAYVRDPDGNKIAFVTYPSA